MMKCAILLLLFVIGTQATWVKEQENPGLFEGDMILDEEQQKEYKAGKLGYATTVGRQWPRGVVYWTMASNIASSSQAQNAINQAIAEYHSKTCIRFERRTNQRGYIEFYQGQGCSSHVGYSGGRMRVNLAQGCWRKSIVVHEIAHALGVYHEQSRPDRDSYVNIHFENIQRNMAYNFNKQSGIDSLGTPYDFNSVMHYKSTAFSSNGRPTITKKSDGSTNFGNDYGLSPIDTEQMNLLYKRQCGGTGPHTRRPPIVTKNPWTRGPQTQRPPPTGCDTYPSCKHWTRSACSSPGVPQYCPNMCSGKC